MSETAGPPRPVPDEHSEPFWRAAADHVLAIARCSRCGRYAHPPGVVCAGCLSTDPAFEFTPVPGAGTVRSWTVVRDSFLPGFADEVPFVVVDVELDVQADLRMIGRLRDGPGAPLHVGARVEVVFEDREVGPPVPAFALTGSTGRST